jgi:type VI secretion system secreted protein Hcp
MLYYRRLGDCGRAFHVPRDRFEDGGIQMALNAYLTLKGQKQGDIHGSVTQKGREGSIMVIAMDHQIVSPRDAASGLPSGKRQHKPLVIIKELDKSTPLLYSALCNNETISSWQLNFWTPQIKATTGVGSEVQNFTIKLTNANVASINFHMPNNKHPELMKLNEYEEVGFTYEKIEWVWTDGAISAVDDWEAPVA